MASLTAIEPIIAITTFVGSNEGYKPTEPRCLCLLHGCLRRGDEKEPTSQLATPMSKTEPRTMIEVARKFSVTDVKSGEAAAYSQIARSRNLNKTPRRREAGPRWQKRLRGSRWSQRSRKWTCSLCSSRQISPQENIVNRFSSTTILPGRMANNLGTEEFTLFSVVTFQSRRHVFLF